MTLLAEFTSISPNWNSPRSSSLMAEIRRIAGGVTVRAHRAWMPSEREHLALSALLVACRKSPEPVLSLDTKGRVELANPAGCLLFGHKPGEAA